MVKHFLGNLEVGFSSPWTWAFLPSYRIFLFWAILIKLESLELLISSETSELRINLRPTSMQIGTYVSGKRSRNCTRNWWQKLPYVLFCFGHPTIKQILQKKSSNVYFEHIAVYQRLESISKNIENLYLLALSFLGVG